MNKRQIENYAERLNRTSYRAFKTALKSGAWARGDYSSVRAENLVDAINAAVAGLSQLGCFDDVYGEFGSSEAALVPGVAISHVDGLRQRDMTPMALAKRCFETVRELDRLGLIAPAARASYRTFAYDEEEAERRRKAEEEAERKRKAEEEAEREKLRERRAAALRRLKEIEKSEKEA